MFFLSVLQLSAQRECTTQQYIQSIKASPKVLTAINDAETFTQNRIAQKSASRLSADFIIRVPVVVHVLYYQASQNIPEAVIKEQIAMLNRDFRRQNSDSVNTPDRFKPYAADAQIEFVLATADPMGRPTTGIVRKPTTVQYWQMDDQIKYTKSGGDDAWDSRSYLNIWVGDMRSLLGYASPIGAPADKDGVVINFSAFGSKNASEPYNMGRTAVHEVGHWLGLKHIWGDTYCGDDNVEDTPKQGNFTSGCPSGVRSTCEGNGASGDMYMNFMDFTNDACMNLFTKGQKERMRIMFEDGGPRASILNSRGANEPWAVEEIPSQGEAPVTATQVKLYPNPVSSELVLDFEYDLSWIGKQVRLLNINGVEVKRVQVLSKIQKLDLSSLRSGIYFVQGINSSNGNKLYQKLVKL